MVLTAVVTGVAAYAVFDLPWTAALLLGAVLAPTDPAILIPLFIGSRLPCSGSPAACCWP